MHTFKKSFIIVSVILAAVLLVFCVSLQGALADNEPTPTPETTPVPTPAPLSHDQNLAMIYINERPIEGFEPANWKSTVNLPEGTASVTITADTSHPGATVSGTGTKGVAAGENQFKLKVTAEDGVSIQEYYVIIIVGSNKPDPFTVKNKMHSLQWDSFVYEYKHDGILISSTIGGVIRINNISSDFTVETTINGTPINDIHSNERNYSVYDYGEIICEYHKEINCGDNIDKEASFPSTIIKIIITDNETGQSETVTVNSEAKVAPSAYDAYRNHRNNGNFDFESRFLDYMQDKRIDQNAEDIKSNKEQIEEIQGKVKNLQLQVENLTCRVDELESDVENLRRISLSFAENFGSDSDLEYINMWYREKPQQVSFSPLRLLVRTAYAAEKEWTYICVDHNEPRLNLDLDVSKEYYICWEACYADNTTENAEYLITPGSEALFTEVALDNVPYEAASIAEAAASNAPNATSAAGTLPPTLPSGEGTITVGTLIIIIAVVLILGAGIGILSFMIGSGKIKKRSYRKKF